MKQQVTKFISLTFAASPVTQAYVNVPFVVEMIHIKSANYDSGTAGLARNVVIESTWGQNAPIAILSQDDTYSQNAIQDIEIKLMTPQILQGWYTFTLKTMSGAIASTSNSGADTDYIGLIVEFNGVDEGTKLNL
jgi:hypothetical protein